ncbi:MAG: peptide ABC transporter substrate-binding protein [Chloroflexota bacterium]
MGKKIIFGILVILTVLTLGCQGLGPTPLNDGELVQLGGDPLTLDPQLASDVTAATYIVEIFGGLVTLDRNLKVAPDLAERWDISDDGKTYTFYLRPDAKFHSGKPVTAEDFKWSFERAADPATRSTTADTYLGDIVGFRAKLRGESQEITGVKVIDEQTLEITIDAPKVYFLSKLTYQAAFVLNRDNVATGPDWFTHPDGTGPFKLREYIRGAHLILERNPYYHLGIAKLESVRFLLAGGTPMALYENNEIQITGVGIDDLDRISDPNSSLSKELHYIPPGFETSYIGLNVTKPPLDDIKVRQALAYAIDKEQIVGTALANRVVPAYGILPPGFPAYNSALQGLTYDPEKAKTLLAESKYGPDPAQWPAISMTIPGELGDILGQHLESILTAWQDILGVTVEIQLVDWPTFLSDLTTYRLQMYEIAWSADYPDPQNFLDLQFDSQSVNNQTRYSNPEVDRLLEAARTERYEPDRYKLYQETEQIIVNEVPWIPLWHPGDGYILIKPEVKDFFLLPVVVPKYRFVYLTK